MMMHMLGGTHHGWRSQLAQEPDSPSPSSRASLLGGWAQFGRRRTARGGRARRLS